MQRDTPPSLWSGQALHFACLACLLALAWLSWDGIGQPQTPTFWVATALPVCHQLYVWIAWRLELSSGVITRAIGFRAYLAVFFTLFAGRFLSLAALAWMDRGSLETPTAAQAIVTTALTLPGLYAMYSVYRYFGFRRAAGADHFFPRYQAEPLVAGGIFRFTNNGMYIFAFLLFWAIAVGLDSLAALIVVAFSHAYIWVHFFCVEKPDMDFLYSSRSAGTTDPLKTS